MRYVCVMARAPSARPSTGVWILAHRSGTMTTTAAEELDMSNWSRCVLSVQQANGQPAIDWLNEQLDRADNYPYVHFLVHRRVVELQIDDVLMVGGLFEIVAQSRNDSIDVLVADLRYRWPAATIEATVTTTERI